VQVSGAGTLLEPARSESAEVGWSDSQNWQGNKSGGVRAKHNPARHPAFERRAAGSVSRLYPPLISQVSETGARRIWAEPSHMAGAVGNDRVRPPLQLPGR